MTNVVLLALVPIFFVLLLGYTAGKFRIVDNTHVAPLNTVLMTYALPASLFVATATTARQEMLGQWPVLVILAGAMMVVYPLWYLFQRRIRRQSPRESAVQALTVALPNYAAVGLPVASLLLGSNHTVPVAVAITAGALLPSPLTLALLELPANSGTSQERGAFMRFIRAMSRALRKPIVLAPVAGTALSLLALPLPSLADTSLHLIGQMTGGLALFVTGLILSAQHFRLSWNTAMAVAVTNIAQPLVAFAIASALPVPAATAHVGILLAALPSGFFGVLFGANYGLNSEAADSALIASTGFALVTLAVAIAWLYG